MPATLPPSTSVVVVGEINIRASVPWRFSTSRERPPYVTVNMRNIKAIPGAMYASMSNLTAAPSPLTFFSLMDERLSVLCASCCPAAIPTDAAWSGVMMPFSRSCVTVTSPEIRPISTRARNCSRMVRTMPALVGRVGLA